MIGTLLRAARTSRGLTQKQLATRSRLDQAGVSRAESGRDAAYSTVERLLAGAGHRLYSAPTHRDDAAEAAVGIRDNLAAGDQRRALRVLLQLNDDLVAERGLVRGVLGLAQPESTRSAVWDAALAGLVAWRLAEERVPLPVWVDDPGRHLKEPRTLEVDPADPIPTESDVPEELLRRGVLVWRDTFASV